MPTSFLTANDWFKAGNRISVRLKSEADRPVNISLHLLGPEDGEFITFLHGFPTCSHDFHQLLEVLSSRFRLLLWDFLGYGDSDKDLGPGFSVHQLADIQEDLWAWCGTTKTHIIAHDLGDTVLQELGARVNERQTRAQGQGVTLGKVMLFNGGIFPDLHRPVLVQRLLLLPVLGAVLSNTLLNETIFGKGIAGVFSPQHPPEPWVLHEMWQAVSNRHGCGNYHVLIRYIHDRRQHQARWEAALDYLIKNQGAEKVYFYWGLQDPVSGAHVAEEIERRFNGYEYGMSARKELGHWPMLEDPSGAEAAMLKFFMGEEGDG